MSKGLVSIIVRTKDRPLLLKRALTSIAAQTYRPIEVVLVNDGGCELDVKAIRSVLGGVSLKYVRLCDNTGRACAGNAGIEHAEGAYVGFLDDDDDLCPDHISTLTFFLRDTDYRIAYTDSIMVYKEYRPEASGFIEVKREAVFSSDFDYDRLLFENYIPFMCLLFERDALLVAGGFDPDLHLYEDWDLLLRIGERYPFHHIKKVTAHYNQWASDLQISQDNRDRNFVEESYRAVAAKHMRKITGKRIFRYVTDVSSLRGTLRELRARSESLERSLTEQTYLTSSLKASLVEKDKAAADLQEMLSQRDRAAADLQEMLSEKDARIGTLETSLSDKGEALSHAESLLSETGRELDAILNTNAWKAAVRYYRLRDRLVPEHSRRRLFLDLVILAMISPRGFLKGLSLQNIRKFFSLCRTVDPSAVERKVRQTTAHFPSNGNGAPPALLGTDDFLADTVFFAAPPEKRALVVDRWVPAYDKDSGSLRMFSLLVILLDLGYRVTFLPDDLQRTSPYTEELERKGVEVLSGAIDIEHYLKSVGPRFSLVVMSRPEQTAKYIALMRAYAVNSTVVYDTVDLHWVRFERAASMTGNRDFLRQAKDYKKLELFNAACADIVFTVTEDEKRVLLSEIPSARVEVVPNIHEPQGTKNSFGARSGVMFIGGFLHQPNEDAVFFFVREIFPRIKASIPDMKFFVVGSDPSPPLRALNSADIVVTGYVKDVTSYFANCRVFVSPLRYGAGMKGKIGQSMAYGLPVVTTHIGAEGMELVNGENAIIADDVEAFAAAVVKLYTDEPLWQKISARALDHIASRFSMKVVARHIERIFSTRRHEEAEAIASGPCGDR